MWIIPSNHPLYSAYAPECVASKEELNLLSDQLEQSLMWRSKPLSLKTWSDKWSRVYWLPHLFGRTLKPSHQNNFTEKYTASLADIPASHFQLPEKEAEEKIPVTSGPTSNQWSGQLDLFGASSKTSPDILPSDTEKSDQTWNNLVTRLKKEYSQRKKLALLTRESDCSSSQWRTPTVAETHNQDYSTQIYLQNQVKWTTPTANDNNRSTKYQQGGTALSMQVKENWKTPQANDGEGGIMYEKTGDGHFKLRDQVHWPTPRSSEWKGTGPKGSKSQKYRLEKHYLDATVEETDGQPSPENPNTNGKRLVLNPAWVLQLMGTTLEKTFFAWREMELLNKQQNSHG